MGKITFSSGCLFCRSDLEIVFFLDVESHKGTLFIVQTYFITGLSHLSCQIWSQTTSHQFFNIIKTDKHSLPMYKKVMDKVL